MKSRFKPSLFDFAFGPDSPDYAQIMAYHAEQLELLYHKPSLAERTEGIASKTYEHSMRVAQDVYDMMRFLGFSQQAASNLKFAAQLHDIGKLDVSPAILNKNGRLTPEEFEHIKQHTHFGVQRLQKLGSTHPIILLAIDIAKHHHERPDGTGYYGLSGPDYPMHIRLVQVCDIYDAIATDRSYRTEAEQLSPQQTLQLMRNPKNHIYNHMDQDLVKKFVLLKANGLAADVSGKTYNDILEQIS
jgi:HD-GYP domain-containing protein (c-di-GMP phosphodiesterase class II)